MAKKTKSKKAMREVPRNCGHGKFGLYFLLLALLAALGFAAIIQGILMQISFGFKYGFFSYLLGFIFIGLTKYLKWKLFVQLKECK